MKLELVREPCVNKISSQLRVYSFHQFWDTVLGHWPAGSVPEHCSLTLHWEPSLNLEENINLDWKIHRVTITIAHTFYVHHCYTGRFNSISKRLFSMDVENNYFWSIYNIGSHYLGASVWINHGFHRHTSNKYTKLPEIKSEPHIPIYVVKSEHHISVQNHFQLRSIRIRSLISLIKTNQAPDIRDKNNRGPLHPWSIHFNPSHTQTATSLFNTSLN